MNTQPVEGVVKCYHGSPHLFFDAFRLSIATGHIGAPDDMLESIPAVWLSTDWDSAEMYSRLDRDLRGCPDWSKDAPGYVYTVRYEGPAPYMISQRDGYGWGNLTWEQIESGSTIGISQGAFLDTLVVFDSNLLAIEKVESVTPGPNGLIIQEIKNMGTQKSVMDFDNVCQVCYKKHRHGSAPMVKCQEIYNAGQLKMEFEQESTSILPLDGLREQTLEMLANARAIDASYEVLEDMVDVIRYFDIETDQQEYNLLEQMDHGVITRKMILEQCGGMTGRIGMYFRLASHRISDADFMKYVPKRMKDLGNQMSRSNAPF